MDFGSSLLPFAWLLTGLIYWHVPLLSSPVGIIMQELSNLSHSQSSFTGRGKKDPVAVACMPANCGHLEKASIEREPRFVHSDKLPMEKLGVVAFS